MQSGQPSFASGQQGLQQKQASLTSRPALNVQQQNSRQQLLQQQHQQQQLQQQQVQAAQRLQSQKQAVASSGRAESPIQSAASLTHMAQQARLNVLRGVASTPNANISPRPSPNSISQIANPAVVAAAREGSPVPQGSPIRRAQTMIAQRQLGQQQTIQQQPQPQQQIGRQLSTPPSSGGEISGAQTQTQTPTGPSARPQPPLHQSQPIMNTQGSMVPQMHIPATLSVNKPIPATVKPTRPTLTGGHAISSPALSTPAYTRPPSFELNGGTARVLSKRKLSELVKDMISTSSSINGVTLNGDQRDANIDGDVEELLLDLADEFVQSVASFSCRLAKHRKSTSLDVKDVQLHLERNWNIRIPGYNADEVRSVRKWNPTQSYIQKVTGVNTSRSISGK
ncbi:transcription initiation factor TFIID subunit A-domain-containing protein [Limtongia smithiae]|uniref:transcription initiation factor TFIID subunit A-domain-containing protein n=1 Tax=Limtongia smithiae TaxID=1125753 RepID=UPI0034CE764D